MLALMIMLVILGVTSIVSLGIFSFRIIKTTEQMIKAIILIVCVGFGWLNVWFFITGLILLGYFPK